LYAQGRTLRQIGAELGVPWTTVGHQTPGRSRHASRRPSGAPALNRSVIFDVLWQPSVAPSLAASFCARGA
jgi:hypothetical protein